MKNCIRLISVLFVLTFLSCATLPTDSNYVVTYSTIGHRSRTEVSFAGPDLLVAQERERAARELRDPENIEVLATLGSVAIVLKDGNINGANPSNSTFILLDNTGREIFRDRGESKVPSVSGGIWSSTHTIVFPIDEVEFPLSLRVIRSPSEIADVTISRRN